MDTKEKTKEKSCMNCLYLATHEKCDGCLSTEEDYRVIRGNMNANSEMHLAGVYGKEKIDPPYRYLNWIEGDGLERGYQFEKEGRMNIVVGGMGEAEVNTLWPPEKTIEILIDVAEQCGYLVNKNNWDDKEKQIEVYNNDGHFRVIYFPDTSSKFRLSRIEKITRNNNVIVIWN
ncbi:hypothetical protein KY345_06060 [Candidatus Woesearchaeota archaeon]|nr:hypothetical protein [Candidatus Woesearchaeota archaeon]